jgi:hypothetical protein
VPITLTLRVAICKRVADGIAAGFVDPFANCKCLPVGECGSIVERLGVAQPVPISSAMRVTFTERNSDAHSDAVGYGHSFELPDPIAEQHSDPVAHTKPNSLTDADANANAVTDSAATPTARSATTGIAGVRCDDSLARGD